MKPKDLTTENTEKKYYIYSRDSVDSVAKTSSKEFPLKEVTARGRDAAFS
jgi:hypothetical protein